jgi:hypothetical protein
MNKLFLKKTIKTNVSHKQYPDSHNWEQHNDNVSF